MRKNYFIPFVLVVLLSLACLFACNANNDVTADDGGYAVKSPDNSLSFTVFHTQDGALEYKVIQNDLTIVEKSRLGFDLEESSLSDGLTFIEKTSTRISYDYDNISGKHAHVSGEGQEMVLTFSKDEFTLKFIARAYNDGYAFRYDVTSNDDSTSAITVNEELTEFALPSQSYTYVQPYRASSNDGNYFSYEETFQEKKFNDLYGMTIAMPMLYRVAKSDVYSLITESELIGSGYYGSFLKESSDNESLGILQTVPTPAGKWGANQTIGCPFTSPWRVGIVGSLETVAESELVEAVYGNVEYWKPDNYDQLTVEEKAIYTYDWVEPGATAWSWLLYQYTDKSNAQQKDYTLQKEYVDVAQQMGWKYVLLDGGWDSTNYTKLTDFCSYAREKGIKILIWMDALSSFDGGDYRTLTRRLDRYAECGVAGIKVDFFDGQTMNGDNDFQGEDTKTIEWYETIYQECAKRKLVVNCHGSNKPTGERRIYPNVICREGVKAYEMYTNLGATEIVNSLFIRNVVGPSDFAPSVIPFKDTISTCALMATSVAYESGMSGLSDRLSVYTSTDYMSFFESFPSAWKDIKFLCGLPSEYYCVAREAVDGSWYVACINNGETPSEITVDFSFLDGDYVAKIYTDGDNAYSVNPADTHVSVESEIVSDSTTKTFNVKEGGGFVIKLTK